VRQVLGRFVGLLQSSVKKKFMVSRRCTMMMERESMEASKYLSLEKLIMIYFVLLLVVVAIAVAVAVARVCG